MSVGRIYGGKNNVRVYKSLITAKLSGITIDWDDTFTMHESNKTDEYLKKFPLGQVPAFESKDGLLLTESSAIPFYLASLKDNNSLLGKSKAELAKIYQYTFFVETQCIPYFITLYKHFNGMPVSSAEEKMTFEKVDQAFSYLDKELESKSYLVGDSLTLADIQVGENLAFAYIHILDESHWKKYPHLTKFITNYRNITEVKEITGETKVYHAAAKAS